MSTINQKRANRLNAKKSTGPKTEAGKEKSRFNALVHGLRAESTLLPGEDVNRFDQVLDSLTIAWRPQDDMERSSSNKLSPPMEIGPHRPRRSPHSRRQNALRRRLRHRHQPLIPHPGPLERNISRTILDLERYRKQRLERANDKKSEGDPRWRPGLVESMNGGPRYFRVQPQIYGIDNVWRFLPRALLGDFSGVPDYDRLPNNQDPPDDPK